MASPIIGVSEPTAAPAETQANSKQHVLRSASPIVLRPRAKKKKKRDAHRAL